MGRAMKPEESKPETAERAKIFITKTRKRESAKEMRFHFSFRDECFCRFPLDLRPCLSNLP
jgi:hypothetical protein